MLEIRHITKAFGSTLVLDGLSLDIRPGEIFTLLGASGCGKTTLLRILAGLERPDQGQVSFKGQAWADGAQGAFVPPQKRGLGLVFQSYAVWPHLNVFDNVAYPLRNQKLDRASIRQKVMATLESVGLAGYHGRAAHQLSGGQQQRVAMARALVGGPDLLLLDEPFSNLDVSLRAQLRHELKALQQRLGLTVVLVTHDQDDAFALSDRIAVLRAGRVEQIGTPEDIHDRPATPFVQQFVGRGSALRAQLAGDRRHALIGSARIPLATPLAAPAGTPLALWARPDAVTLRGTRGEGGPGLYGQVAHSIFAGDRYETFVRLPGAQLLMVYQPRHQPLAPDSWVEVVFSSSPHASPLANQV
ncbi:ATP-binding cassette domain-containing protein [Pseudomonas sp. NPDC007930]|uniref:ABC transporter ATP-binding protein n=1 Tax=Pseudomonas sp. NPDC007930 TaxID=3364417 RepID=UPI0036EA8D44